MTVLGAPKSATTAVSLAQIGARVIYVYGFFLLKFPFLYLRIESTSTPSHIPFIELAFKHGLIGMLSGICLLYQYWSTL